ncbi:hypothetical protein HMPREF1248_1566 [Coriobacteriaceae bacterium BV3Ac1]|nr:hypothetical protein HMPREF1248_1566 [Coriobacteriaceae bacterium BV3Ac1]
MHLAAPLVILAKLSAKTLYYSPCRIAMDLCCEYLTYPLQFLLLQFNTRNISA